MSGTVCNMMTCRVCLGLLILLALQVQPIRCREDYENHSATDKTKCKSGEANCSAITCKPDEFTCNNGDCIRLRDRCDGHSDCNDGEDEDNCQLYCKSLGKLACENDYGHPCLDQEHICDGSKDCHNGEDEDNCPVKTCRQDEFTCHDGACIDEKQRCDGHPDCMQSEDEESCVLSCESGEISCGNKFGRQICVDETQICDGYPDCFDDRDEKNCSKKCEANEFTCNNGACITGSWKCDGHHDCPDGEDEESCGCEPGEVKCASIHGACLPSVYICDGHEHCENGEDEQNCIPKTCSQDDFLCDTDDCYPNSWRCDGHFDCADETDEDNCEVTCKPGELPCRTDFGFDCLGKDSVCDGHRECLAGEDEEGCPCDPDEEFRCNNGECVSSEWRCDGEPDCEDGEDEQHCSPETSLCPSNNFQCADHSCILLTEVCDHVANCAGGEDEVNCTTYKGSGNPANHHGCDYGYNFRCYDGSCIHKSEVCDGHADCDQGEDETSLQCGKCCANSSDFQCGNGECVPAEKRCDGIRDCSDQTDEVNEDVIMCIELLPSTIKHIKFFQKSCLGEFYHQCDTNVTNKCIERRKLCDGTKDCIDGTDESICNQTCRDYGCRQECEVTTQGPKCKCREGFVLVENTLCEDINECQVRNGGCNQLCVNTHGSFHCACFEGFALSHEDDGYADHEGHEGHQGVCRAAGVKPQLYVSTWSGIKAWSRSNETLAVSLPTNALHMDVNSHTGDIIWVQKQFVKHGESRGHKHVRLMGHRMGHSRHRYGHRHGHQGKNSHHDMKIFKKSGNSELQLVVDGLHKVEGLSVDWLTGNVFITEKVTSAASATLRHKLSVVGVNGFKATLINNKRPMWSAVVHPSKSMVYWLSVDFGNFYVMGSLMNGENMTFIVEVGTKPSALCIDYVTERFYWLSIYSRQIETSKLDGSDRYTAVSHLPCGVAGMDVFEGWAYLTYPYNNASNVQAIATFDELRRKGKGWTFSGSPTSIRLSHVHKQPKASPVPGSVEMVKACRYLGVLTPTGGQCLCPDGLTLNSNGTCVDIETSTSLPCVLSCLNGGVCVHTRNSSVCSCITGYTGSMCETNELYADDGSPDWLAPVITVVMMLIAVGIVVGCYFRYKRNNATLMSAIKFVQRKTSKDIENDKSVLIPELSFGNPNFQEESERDQEETKEFNTWWEKVLVRGRRSVDSAYRTSESGSGSSGDVDKLDDMLTPLGDDDNLTLI